MASIKTKLLPLLLFALEAWAQPTVSFETRTSGYATSETSGPAPLGVLLDATATTSALTSLPFHDLLYVWDFGDPGSGTWQYGVGNLSKNRAFGPIAGHLYKTPGTYTIRLTVRDRTGVTSTATSTVTVVSPESVFTPTNTWCYANSADTFVGCALDTVVDEGVDDVDDTPGDGICTGTNSSHCVVTSDFDELWVNLGTARRHQFRRGDTFAEPACPLQVAPNQGIPGNGFIEGFGTGPRVMFDCLNHGTPGISEPDLFDLSSTEGYNLMNLQYDSKGVPGYGGGLVTQQAPFDGDAGGDFTFYDWYVKGGSGLFALGGSTGGTSPSTDITTKDFFAQELEGDAVGGYSACVDLTPDPDPPQLTRPLGFIFGYFDHAAFLGIHTRMHDSPMTTGTNCNWVLENNFRLMDHKYVVVSNNKFENGSDDKNIMSLRACHATGGCPSELVTDVSKFNVFSDNEIYGSTAVGGVAISMQEEHRTDQANFDYIFERNYYTCGVASCQGTAANLVGRSGPNGTGSRITVRNNIVNGRNLLNSNNLGIVSVGTTSNDHVIGDWWVYNNTLYDDAGASRIQIVSAGTGNFTIRGNLVYAPTKSPKLVSFDLSGTGDQTITESNNLFDGAGYQYLGSPFVADGGSKDTPLDFRLSGTVTSGANPVNNGYNFTGGPPYVFTDMFALCRPAGANWDAGAHELGANTSCLPFGVYADNTENCSASIGMNTNRNYHDESMLWVNMMKKSRGWRETTSGACGTTSVGYTGTIDSNGYPLQFGSRICLQTEIESGAQSASQWPLGTWVLRWDGDASTTTFAVAEAGSALTGTGNRRTFTMGTTTGGLNLQITAMNESDPPKNMRVYPPGGICADSTTAPYNFEPWSYCSTARCSGGVCDDAVACSGSYPNCIDLEDAGENADARLHPLLVKRLKPYRLLRFMDWLHTNDSANVDYADWTPTSYVTWDYNAPSNPGNNVPLEVIADLCNAVDTECWVNIPHQATDANITQTVTFFRDNVDSSIPIYLEYSNEVWNGSFSANLYAKTQGSLENPAVFDGANCLTGTSAQQDDCEDQWYGKRTYEMCNIAQGVFDAVGQGNRLQCVMARQATNVGRTTPSLECGRWIAAGHGGNCYTNSKVDLFSITGYIGGQAACDSSTTAAQVCSALDASSLSAFNTTTGALALQHAELASHGITWPIVAYEGGSSAQDMAQADCFGALTDSCIRTSYMTMLDRWKANAGLNLSRVFNHFDHVEPYVASGLNFAVRGNLEGDSSAWPKEDGLLDWQQVNQCWWPGCSTCPASGSFLSGGGISGGKIQ